MLHLSRSHHVLFEKFLMCFDLYHEQALKELRAKAQKGPIGGAGLKKSGKK